MAKFQSRISGLASPPNNKRVLELIRLVRRHIGPAYAELLQLEYDAAALATAQG